MKELRKRDDRLVKGKGRRKKKRVGVKVRDMKGERRMRSIDVLEITRKGKR